MNLFAIERDGSLINHLTFIGSSSTNLYRESVVAPLTFTSKSSAQEVVDLLDATVVDYQLYIAQPTQTAA